MDAGRDEATELNQTFGRLKLEVLQAKADLHEYVTAHTDVVDENTPGFQQLQERIEAAVKKLYSFEKVDLGLTMYDLGMAEKPEEANAAK